MSASSPAGGAFESILKNFEYSIEGYRLFLNQLHGQIKDSYREEISDRMTRIAATLDRQDRARFEEGLNNFVDMFRSSDDEDSTGEGDADGSRTEFSVEFSSGSAYKAFEETIDLIMRAGWTGPGAQLERLYRSVIIGLVGQFEVLISDVAHQYFKHAPRALNEEEKVLSLSDLQEFGSVEVALDYLVEREIDGLLAQSVEGWAKFFEKRMNIQLQSMAWDWEVFKEIIQRRHIIVHADGRVSRRYLQYVSSELVEEYFGEGQIGQTSWLDRDYVERALDHFEILGTLFCCAAWVKLDKQSRSRFGEMLTDWIYERLLKGRWEMALTMAQEAGDDPRLGQSTRIVCRYNAWLCLKRMGRFGEVEELAEAFDDSALEERFRFVRLALLDREEQLLELLEATEGRGLDHDAWHEWPVFSEIRTNPQFTELAERFAPATDAGEGEEAAGEAVQKDDNARA